MKKSQAKKKIKNKGGRPPWIPTEDQQRQIEALAGFGLRDNDIALIIGTSEATLKNKCRGLLDSGRAKALAKVSQTAHQMAASGKWPVMTIFYLKVRGGWREKTELQHDVRGFPQVIFGEYGMPGFTKLPTEPGVPRDDDDEDNNKGFLQ